MSNQKNNAATDGSVPDRIDSTSEKAVADWARKLDSTEMQIRDAVAEVGNLATDVEMHLKGTRSTTNVDRVDEASNKP